MNGDLKDIEAGVDSLIAKGIVDANNLAIIGYSAGGLRANWLAVATHRYKAIVSIEGWADELIMWLKNEDFKLMDAWFGGSPIEVPENYTKNSPQYHTSGATTPILFLMGNPEKGGTNIDQNVLHFFDTLKKISVDTDYVSYPDEGHMFEQPENRWDVLNRSIKWIDEHFSGRD